MRFLIHFLLVFVCIAGAARAEVFVWQDEETKYTVSYPDLWGMVNNHKPDDVLTIYAPTDKTGKDDHAACRLRVNTDGRFKIYPRELAGEIQRTNVSKEFFQLYLQEFMNPVLFSVTDNAGLGHGFAGMAQAGYTDGPDNIRKRGLIFATVYNDKSYVLECSAARDAYPKYHPQFVSILKSITFRPEYAQKPNGYYRDFLGDDPVIIAGKTKEEWETH